MGDSYYSDFGYEARIITWRKFMFRKTAVAISLLTFAAVAQAGVVYDNLGSVTSGADPLSTWGPPLFDSFSTGAGGFALANVKLLLSGTSDASSLTVALYNDNATSPGTLLTLIGSLNDTSLSATLTVFDFVLATPYWIAPNTRDWIVLNTADGSSANWAWSDDQAAVGVAGEYFGHGTSVFSDTGGPYQMQLSDSGVPEPSTLLLALIGGSVLVARRRIAR